jgi:hypothetical protein
MVDWSDRTGEAEDLVREGDRAEQIASIRRVAEQLGHEPHEIRCIVSHEDAGGKCGREAVMEVYGLTFCEVHGEEAKAGALEELYHDALQFMELFDAPHVRTLNPEVQRIVSAGVTEIPEWTETETEEALLRAFPLIPERMDNDTQRAEEDLAYGTSYSTWRETRRVIHMLMRFAYQEGEDWLVEVLEHHREQNSAQAAFALVELRRYEAQAASGNAGGGSANR